MEGRRNEKIKCRRERNAANTEGSEDNEMCDETEYGDGEQWRERER